MKKTLNINLAGYPFTIDEDAYNLLKDYLDTIKYAFDNNDDTGEIASDIESRIAELLLEKESGKFRIVSAREVTEVINRIGQPSDFIETIEEVDVKEEENIKETAPTPPPYNPQYQSNNPFVRKKLFRDPQNSMLGGVCSGLAMYLNWDVTIVRLITVVLFFLSASTVAIVYIILWIIVPAADSPLQRMQMKGENPTMENIGRNVTETYREETDNSNSLQNNSRGFFSQAISVFVKCLIIFGLIIAAPVLIAVSAVLIGCVIAVFVISIGIFSGGMFDSLHEGLMVLFILFAVIGGAITLGVPIWLLFRKALKKSDSSSNPSTRRALLIIWLCGIAMVSVFSVRAVKESHKLQKYDWGVTFDKIEDIDIDLDDNNVGNIKISSSGIKIRDKKGKVTKIGPTGINIGISEESVVDSNDSIVEKETITDTIVSVNPLNE